MKYSEKYPTPPFPRYPPLPSGLSLLRSSAPPPAFRLPAAPQPARAALPWIFPRAMASLFVALAAIVAPAAALSSPIVWSIAGSDSGGGAGLQADLLTIHDLKCHACTVPTALTAQNSVGVSMVEYGSTDLLRSTIECLREDLPPAAVKTGMLGTKAVIDEVERFLKDFSGYRVCDPVMVATSGARLLPEDAVEALVAMLPSVDLLTPNLQEAEALLGRELSTPAAVERAADDLLAMGPGAVLIKGGHGSDAALSMDFFAAAEGTALAAGEVRRCWICAPRYDTPHTHGTGCTLSAAVAAGVARGLAPLDAVMVAKAYVTQGIAAGKELGGLGGGPGPVRHMGEPTAPAHFPFAVLDVAEEKPRPLAETFAFPPLVEPMRLLPIVGDAAWTRRVASAGARDVQLRMKGLAEEECRAEAEAAAAACEEHGCRLWINDDWRLAAEVGAFGVHLGQEDLQAVREERGALEALRRSGLRLGISTHCHAELAMARAVRPSYISLGPVFGTRSKKIAFGARGIAQVREWRTVLPEGVPLVAIGGIEKEGERGVRAVMDAGAEGVAVISAVTGAEDPEAELEELLRLTSGA